MIVLVITLSTQVGIQLTFHTSHFPAFQHHFHTQMYTNWDSYTTSSPSPRTSFERHDLPAVYHHKHAKYSQHIDFIASPSRCLSLVTIPRLTPRNVRVTRSLVSHPLLLLLYRLYKEKNRWRRDDRHTHTHTHTHTHKG